MKTTKAAKKTMEARLHNVNLELVEAEGWAAEGKPGAKAMVKALWTTLKELSAKHASLTV